jgi:class 3 adenylate cyclase/predicted ATPase
MHRVVPEIIVENYRAGRYQGDFQAVGMFLDLTGFSNMTDALMQHGEHGAEVLASLMHVVFDPLVETIFNYGGKIVSFAGDGIMALFPVEHNPKEIAIRALASAWIIQRGLLENPMRQTVYGNFLFSVKIGIAVGEVSWGILRSHDQNRATYFFRGSAVDDSAKAEHAARAGEILITEETHELLKMEVEATRSASFYHLTGLLIDLPDPKAEIFPPIDLAISRLFMPEEVITEDLRGEFRQIVNLFMRMLNLPYEKIQSFMQIAFELNETFGGLINRMDFGDKGCNMLMLWGAPKAHENDIGRALDFVLELKQRVDFSITAGVTYYVAHAGYLGSPMCEDYTCYGWGINLASRFMISAPDHEIWVDERISRRVKNRFEFESRSAQYFKGFAAEQKVFALTGRKSQELFHQGEFVGREMELPRLIDSLQPLWQKKFAGLIVAWGEAGIGKSRLVYETRSALQHSHKLTWALCHSDQILRHSFNPFRYWLIRYFGIDSHMDDATQKQIFDARLNQLLEHTADPELAGELDRTRTVLGSLLDLYWEDSFYALLDAEGRYNNTLKALIALIKAESLQQPLVLFLEDAQFLDEDSQAFLIRLKNALMADSNVEYPVALLVSSRHSSSILQDIVIDVSIDVEPLSTQALFDLAEIYLGGKVSPDLVHVLQTRSEGNPYFADQILVHLQEEHLLEMSDQGWKVARRLQESSLPADLRSLLVARLDQLAYSVKDVVLTAAVLGREFQVPALATMLKVNGMLPQKMAEAERASVWSASRPFHYMFTHGLLRDAAYAMQMRARRIELHATALEALEKIYGVEAEHHYGELAYHAERARLPDQAYHYLRLAAKVAADAYQNSQAVEYYTRALAFVDPDDLAAQFDLLAERVELYSRMGKRELQLKDLNALERWAEQIGDPERITKVLMWRSAFSYFIGMYPAAIEQAENAEQRSTALMMTELGLYTQVVRFMALLYIGRTSEAVQAGQLALERSRQAHNQKEEGRILTALGLVLLENNELVSAQQYLVEAVEIARELKDWSLQSRALNNLAKYEGDVHGDFARARGYHEEAYKLTREMGDRQAESIMLNSLGFDARMEGDLIAARLYYEQSLKLAREVASQNIEAYSLINLSAIAGITGDVASALRQAQQAAELTQRMSQRSLEAWSMLYMGHAFLLGGQFELAQNAYRKSVEIRHELNQPTLSMEPIAGLVEAYLQENNVEAATLEAEKILSFFWAGATFEGTDEPLRIYYACYLLLEKRQDPRAQQIINLAINLLETQVLRLSDESARQRYIENSPWRRAIYDLSQFRH